MNVHSAGRTVPIREPRPNAGLDEHFWPAVLGELAGPLGHEFNNFLNNVLLEIAILDSRVPESTRRHLATLRNYASRVTDLVRRFQDFPVPRSTDGHPVGLNPIVRDVTAFWERAYDNSRFHLELADDLPPVLAPAADLQRLIFLMLKDAAERSAGQESIFVRSRHADKAVHLSLENLGAPFASDLAFEPRSLELTACKLIVGRLDGALHCLPSSDGKARLLIELPSAPHTHSGECV
jgi:signal transduction histidine kinase